MSKYQNALDNLKHIINLVGANKYKEDLELIQELINERQNTEVSSRTTAIKLLEDTMLYGDFYYTMEDWVTAKLSGSEEPLPFQMESEYLKCALRVEVRDFFEGNTDEYTDEDIENVVDILLDSFSENVLNMDFIAEETMSYIRTHKEVENNE